MVSILTISTWRGKNLQACYIPTTEQTLACSIVEHVTAGLVPNMTTEALQVCYHAPSLYHTAHRSRALQTLTALSAANMTTLHPDYSILAARLELVSLHKRTPKSFSAFVAKTKAGTILRTLSSAKSLLMLFTGQTYPVYSQNNS